MNGLPNKKIILAITGSIAAYKAAFLTRLLVKSGAEVKVLMTEAATKFISPLTLSTLSKHPVITEIVSENSWNSHVELGLWGDAFIIAPATATTLARLANGLADNIIAATYLSARCPVFIAPAMDLDMWRHPATQRNVKTLLADGVQFLPIGFGELASGLIGEGRMTEPEEIIQYLENHFSTPLSDLKGKKIVVTAGPTYEALDPVRFIGNRSSGKMGIAIAEALANRGAKVHLILGPSTLKATNPNIETSKVESAQEMYKASVDLFPNMDAAILSAAVADYRPAQISQSKIKKQDTELILTLEKTLDIAATLGLMKRKNQVLVGFALETDNEIENALGKLKRKNLNFIVLNSLRDAGAGFNHDTNKISIIFDKDNIKQFDLQSKKETANLIVNELANALK